MIWALWHTTVSCWEQHGYTVVKKGWDGMQAVAFNRCLLVVRGPKGVKKICPKPLCHQHQPKPLVQGRPCVSLCKLQSQFPVLISQEWHPPWSSAAVTHVLNKELQWGAVASYQQSGKQGIFSQKAATYWIFLLSFSGHSLWTLEMVTWEIPSRSADCEIVRAVCLALTAMTHSKLLRLLSSFWCSFWSRLY